MANFKEAVVADVRRRIVEDPRRRKVEIVEDGRRRKVLGRKVQSLIERMPTAVIFSLILKTRDTFTNLDATYHYTAKPGIRRITSGSLK